MIPSHIVGNCESLAAAVTSCSWNSDKCCSKVVRIRARVRACIPDTTEIFYVALFVPCSLTSPLLMGLEGVQCITFSYHTVPMNTHKHCTHTHTHRVWKRFKLHSSVLQSVETNWEQMRKVLIQGSDSKLCLHHRISLVLLSGDIWLGSEKVLSVQWMNLPQFHPHDSFTSVFRQNSLFDVALLSFSTLLRTRRSKLFFFTAPEPKRKKNYTKFSKPCTELQLLLPVKHT